jgi:hypothetical protein
MPTTAEHIAIEALRQIAHGKAYDPVLVAKIAIEQIDEMNKPTVHHLSAADVIIDKPPGGGLD